MFAAKSRQRWQGRKQLRLVSVLGGTVATIPATAVAGGDDAGRARYGN
jgi:hypothetical protein